MNRTHRRVAAALAASLTIALAGCSTKAEDSSGGASASDGIKTGPGVTDSMIKLGVISDLSGPQAPLGKAGLQAEQLYLKQLNAAGGVCGRSVELVVKDHGLDVQKAVASYAEIEPDIAAITQLAGSAQTAALVDGIERDKVLTLPLGTSGTLLGKPQLRLVGTTYDIGMVNGVDFLVKAAKLKAGDKLGQVYMEGEYGGNAAEGARFAAKKAGLELVEQTVKPTDTDLTSQVTALRAAGVKAIVISGTPGQTASLVGVAAATGLKVPVLASAPGYVAQLLDTPAKPALEKMLYVTSAFPALSSKDSNVAKLVADYTKEYPKDQVNQAVQAGAANAAVMVGVLKAACQAKDLTREGITTALGTLTQYSEGFSQPQDFSDTGKASSRENYILQPVAGVPGGLKTVQEAFEVPAVAEYLAAAGH